MTICIDRLPELGEFLELEALAEAENYPKVRASLVRAEESLKLTAREDRSYLKMVLKKNG